VEVEVGAEELVDPVAVAAQVRRAHLSGSVGGRVGQRVHGRVSAKGREGGREGLREGVSARVREGV